MGILAKLLGRSPGTDLPVPSYSNEAVLARIEKEEGVDRETARAWFGEMLIFLDLCARSDKLLAPPPDVDRAWHAFLLHSRDYEAYCRERFGKVIHHQPGDEPDPAAYKRAYKRRQEYGGADTNNAYLWATPAFVGSGDDSSHGDWDASNSGSGDGGGSGGDSGGGGSGGGSSCGGGGCSGGS